MVNHVAMDCLAGSTFVTSASSLKLRYRQNSISRMMIGIGTPNSQSSAPFPSPIVATMVVIEIRAAAVPSKQAPQRGSSQS